MTDVAGVKPDALARAHEHLMAALLPDPTSARQSLVLAPLVRTMAVCAASAALAARQASLVSHAAAAMPSLLIAPVNLKEATAIAIAVARQWQTVQAQWIDGWTDLAEKVGSARRPDTLTKYVDQESNHALQALALWTGQATAVARAQEVIMVGLAWWLSRRADAPAGAFDGSRRVGPGHTTRSS